jgi:molecular chaperone DnaK
MYAEAQAAAGQAGAQPGGAGGGSQSPKEDENVVDAEFTEVKDKK